MIKQKFGICVDCPDNSKEKPLTAKRCIHHYWIYREEVAENKRKMREKMNVFLGEAKIEKKKQKPIPKVSQKQVERLAQYRKVRDHFMKENLLCQAKLNGCTVKATDLHHLAGRLGDALTDKKYFMALCRMCHNKIEDGGKWVYDLGFKIKRLEKL